MRSAIVDKMLSSLLEQANKSIVFDTQPTINLAEWVKKNHQDGIDIAQKQTCLEGARHAFFKMKPQELMLRFDDCISYIFCDEKIVSSNQLAILLSYIEIEKPADIIFWHGLISSYFLYDLKYENGKTNWKKIRQLLHDNLQFIKKSSDNLYPWANFLAENADFFTDSPGKNLAEESVRLRKDTTNELTQNINVPPNSWFWQQYLLTKIELAERSDDFSNEIQYFFEDLDKEQFVSVRDQAIAVMIEICYKKGIAKHQNLLDFSVKYWKAPYRDTKEGYSWRALSDGAYKMVLAWYTSEFLIEVFGGLKPYEKDKTLDGKQQLLDVNRLRFWSRYIDAIGGRCFVLFGEHFNQQSRQLFKVMEKYTQHVGKQSGDKYNFSFVIDFGNILVLVSTHTGNALHFYTRNYHPKALDDCNPTKYSNQKSISHPVLNINELKDKYLAESNGGKWISQDPYGNWMQIAEQFLKDNGVFPDPISEQTLRSEKNVGSHVLQATSQSIESFSENTQFKKSTITNHSSNNAVTLIERLLQLAKEYHLNISDRRDKGGVFWITYFDEDDDQFETLKRIFEKLGCSYVRHKGFWLKNELAGSMVYE